jgi:dTDP-4-dehydrorhamnose 3,5-epimerase
MIVEALTVPGAYLVRLEPSYDDRGYFARLFDARDFARHGLCSSFVQYSASVNKRRGIVRGLHYQAGPYGEEKLIRCVRGRIYDVLLDVRADSPAYGRWCAVELCGGGLEQVYAPRGVAHGYQTLTDEAEVCYAISTEYTAEAARGYRYDSPKLAIPWPLSEGTCSQRDASWPWFEP